MIIIIIVVVVIINQSINQSIKTLLYNIIIIFIFIFNRGCHPSRVNIRQSSVSFRGRRPNRLDSKRKCYGSVHSANSFPDLWSAMQYVVDWNQSNRGLLQHLCSVDRFGGKLGAACQTLVVCRYVAIDIVINFIEMKKRTCIGAETDTIMAKKRFDWVMFLYSCLKVIIMCFNLKNLWNINYIMIKKYSSIFYIIQVLVFFFN